MTSALTDEISLAIELVTKLQSAIEYRHYFSDAVPLLHDQLSDWLVSAGKELCESEEQSALNELRRRQTNGARGFGA